MLLNRILQFFSISTFFSSLIYLGFAPKQSDFTIIFSCFTLAFIAYALLVSKKMNCDFRLLLIASITIRIILIFPFPNLSDDIYRFIWDGRLQHIGINPYAAIPSELVGSNPILPEELFNLLNSPDYYSIYPPINQVVNYLSTYFSTTDYLYESVIYKSLLFVFDMISMFAVFHVLKKLELSKFKMFLYFLNPLVIIEISGNGHFEGVMIAFLALSLFFIVQKKAASSAVAFSLSVGSKLLPIMFAPAIFMFLRNRSAWSYIFIAILATLLIFLPAGLGIHLETMNLFDSIDLYVKKFEFNGSIYYLLRFIGYKIYGYNMIHILGPILTLATIVSILYISYRQKQNDYNQLIVTLFFSFTIFLFLSRTVHPWYLCIPIFLCIFNHFRFPIIWSYLITLTYINYSYSVYKENYMIVIFEYTIVFCFAIWELSSYRKTLKIKEAVKTN